MVTNQKTTLASAHFGEIEWDAVSELLLPFGLPGFEDERRMVAVEVPAQRPLVFLQSAEKPEVCFVALPVRAIRPDFELSLSDDDRFVLRMDDSTRTEIGADVLCLALLFPGPAGIETNLGAPIVINLRNLRCIQADGGATAGRYRLGDGRWESTC
ncbi:MAG: flagellar assembly protein FliW [Acidobacteriota bacterium]